MPEEGSKIYFKNHHKMLPVPFVIYADFEAINEKIDSCQPSDSSSYTTTYQRHRACGFGYEVVCHYDKSYSKPVAGFCVVMKSALAFNRIKLLYCPILASTVFSLGDRAVT